MFDPELELFKRNIDLHAFAESLGYRVDLRESWGLRTSRPHFVMRDGRNDKITVAQDPGDGHWIYTSDRDPRDNGSIIDFLQHRTSENLGHIRKRLRAWAGSSLPLTPWVPPAVPWKDRETVQQEYGRMKLANRQPYLEGERRIPATVLTSARFAGRIRIDERGAAIFPHFDAAGLAGFERKNAGFTGFSTGGTKALWESHDLPDDAELVIAESAIDALSYATLFPSPRCRYRSVGGNPSEAQLAMLQVAITDMPHGSAIIAATDNDPPGRKLAATLGTIVLNANRPDLTFRLHTPPQVGSDWNDVLKSHPLPTAPLPLKRTP